jgi:hypothetical protein
MLLWFVTEDPFHDAHALGMGARVYEIAEASDHVDAHELEACALLLVDGRIDSTHDDMRAAQLYAAELENGRLAQQEARRA